MTWNDLQFYRTKLLSLAARLSGDVAELSAEAFRTDALRAAEAHPADEPGHACDDTVTRSLLDNEEEILGEVGAALARIENGMYGMCQDCGSAVPRDRLRAVPYTRFCVACASRNEARAPV
jgi:RNA polymerase-binding transcription factor DksA